MPYKKIPCPVCGQLMDGRSEMCRKCKPTYQRTLQHREAMSELLRGHSPRGTGWKHSDETRQKMKSVWTDEKKEAKRQEMLLLNPDARYHGLSCKGAKRLKDALGHCELCGSDGSESRLDVHHRNGNKQDQSLSNLVVLCHRCHMAVHAEQGETGWNKYWEKRKQEHQ